MIFDPREFSKPDAQAQLRLAILYLEGVPNILEKDVAKACAGVCVGGG